ncbi:hypothetical protein BU26DRAFT_563472 [Trematosphaeria pertusa]|uniref:Uncharacterized protein n=1 Tax=Trematosphaeria pertusa TaxID=390896 RepID=A0A6A6IPM1_9PLEO|nr:uncharacterized protein BU26DRAFT_563472 [Trematosphaeria pertusa]KAF2251540.1 hypothetical protein BU26DRAFT_563472 [Trematosphaeria pertusa]
MVGRLFTTLCLLALGLAISSPDRNAQPMTAGDSNPNAIAPAWQHGVCSFHAQLYQYCPSKGLVTQLTIPQILDNAHRTILRPNGGSAFVVGDKSYVIEPTEGELDKPLEISWYQDVGKGPKKGTLFYSYGGGDCAWWSDEVKTCAGCGWGDWTSGPLDCGTAGEGAFRTSDMDCSFAC